MGLGLLGPVVVTTLTCTVHRAVHTAAAHWILSPSTGSRSSVPAPTALPCLSHAVSRERCTDASCSLHTAPGKEEAGPGHVRSCQVFLMPKTVELRQFYRVPPNRRHSDHDLFLLENGARSLSHNIITQRPGSRAPRHSLWDTHRSPLLQGRIRKPGPASHAVRAGVPAVGSLQDEGSKSVSPSSCHCRS